MDSSTPHTKYFTTLVMFYLTISLCSLVVAQKMCLVAGISVMAGSLIYPLTFPLCDILTEIYGYKKTQAVVWLSFVFQIIFALICLVIVNIESPSTYLHANDYVVVLGYLLRIALGSLVAAILGSFLNIYLISKSKIMLRGRYFGLRSLFSSFVSEFFYTSIAIFMMSYGKVPTSKLGVLIASSMMVKVIYNLITIIPASLLVLYLKKATREEDKEDGYLMTNIIKLNTVLETK
ncbi:MAG: queuosine precursor transporter [Gammaproteobacteria bacterium]